MAAGEEALAVLRSIDASLKTLVQLAQQRQQAAHAPSTVGANPIAPDSDLDSQYGDSIIKAKDPKDWSGPSMKGKRYSECPPAYLELLAQRFDYFAAKAEHDHVVAGNGNPKAPYDRREAARCRGWAQRLKNGWKPPATDSGFASSEWPDDVASL